MAQNETWLSHDMMNPVKVKYLDGNLFSMDNAGNLIGVKLTKDGTDYSGGGSVSANVIRSDGGTVAVSGALSGNIATVVLPQAAYAVPGVVSIVMKLTVSGEVTTIAAVVANVYESTTSTTVDPGTIIPSVQALISQIDTAVASIPADYSSLWTSLAPAFSTSNAYAVGDYVTYDGGLYRFTSAHAAGSWSASDVSAAVIGNDLRDLKSAFNGNAFCPNLIGMTLGKYPVFIPAGTYITVSTSDGSNAPSGHGTQIRVWSANGTMIDYWTAPSAGSNKRTILIEQDVYFLDWNQLYSIPLMVNFGIDALPYVKYYPGVKRIQEEIDDITEDITDAENDIDQIDAQITEIKGALDAKYQELTGTTQTGKYIRGSDGTIQDITGVGWAVVSYSVTEGKQYKIDARAYSNNYYFAWYNSSSEFISGVKQTESGTQGITNEVVIAPTNAVTLAVSSNNDNQKAEEFIGYQTSKKWNGYKWVVFGDSLTEENRRTTKHYFDYVAEKTGITTYNMGNSGSGYYNEKDINTAFFQRISEVPTDADVITIFGSFNDLSHIANLGTATDTTTDTIGGCMNKTLDNLFTAFPLANVGVVAPTPWQGANPTNEPNNASAYVSLLESVCKRRGIPFLDMFHCSQLRPWESSYRSLCYSKDDGGGTHPDETGHKIIAPEFEAFLDRLILH